MPPRGHTHWEGGPTCDLPTKKACEERKADWDAMQQVILAYNIAARGETKPYRKGDTLFNQLVRYIAGEQDDIVNGDGNPNMGPFAVRLRRAIDRVKAGDLPEYNLYEPVSGH